MSAVCAMQYTADELCFECEHEVSNGCSCSDRRIKQNHCSRRSGMGLETKDM